MSSITTFPRSLSVLPSKLLELERAFMRQGFDTQEKFAKNIGVHADTVRKFRQGKNISRRNFQDICEALELDWVEWAFGDEALMTEGELEGYLLTDLEDSAKEVESESDILDADVEEISESVPDEKLENPQKKEGITVTQTSHINNGFMIGNVQGDLKVRSHQDE